MKINTNIGSRPLSILTCIILFSQIAGCGFYPGCEHHKETQLNLIADLEYEINGIDAGDQFPSRAILFSLRTEDYNSTEKYLYRSDNQNHLFLDFEKLKRLFDELEIKPEKMDGTEFEVGQELGVKLSLAGAAVTRGTMTITAVRKQTSIPESSELPNFNTGEGGPTPPNYFMEFEIRGTSGESEIKVVGRAYMAKRPNYSFTTGDCS